MWATSMKIYISIKQAGKRKDYITKKELVLSKVPLNLRELISEIVQINAVEYNSKASEPRIIKYLSSEEIENQAETGKVGFGDRKNSQQADVTKAIDTALLAFQDGIYRVFIGDNEVSELDGMLSLLEGDILNFIRFTMLAGRMW